MPALSTVCVAEAGYLKLWLSVKANIVQTYLKSNCSISAASSPCGIMEVEMTRRDRDCSPLVRLGIAGDLFDSLLVGLPDCGLMSAAGAKGELAEGALIAAVSGAPLVATP